MCVCVRLSTESVHVFQSALFVFGMANFLMCVSVCADESVCVECGV